MLPTVLEKMPGHKNPWKAWVLARWGDGTLAVRGRADDDYYFSIHIVDVLEPGLVEVVASVRFEGFAELFLDDYWPDRQVFVESDPESGGREMTYIEPDWTVDTHQKLNWLVRSSTDPSLHAALLPRRRFLPPGGDLEQVGQSQVPAHEAEALWLLGQPHPFFADNQWFDQWASEAEPAFTV